MPKLPLVYPSASVLPVLEKSTPVVLLFGGGFLASAKMPAGESLLATAVLMGADAKEKHADGAMKSRNAIGHLRGMSELITLSFVTPGWWHPTYAAGPGDVTYIT